jgi:CheY-like chemotaxis protein
MNIATLERERAGRFCAGPSSGPGLDDRPRRAALRAPHGKMGSYVLIVEDDPDIREVICDLLRVEGHVVREAADGLQALELLTSAAELPFLILLDLMMPRMNGWELVERLCADTALALVPVCTVSAMDGPVEGVAHALRKPVEVEELLAIVARFAGSMASSAEN